LYISFPEIPYVNEFILLLSKTILIVPSTSVSLISLIVIASYLVDVWFLPMRTFEVLMEWFLPSFTSKITLVVLSCIVDIVGVGLICFLGITDATNFSAIIHLFMTDGIGKLK